VENAFPQQIMFGAAVHLPLDKLESIDLPLGLAIAPWQG
jgi:hypothetical protein